MGDRRTYGMLNVSSCQTSTFSNASVANVIKVLKRRQPAKSKAATMIDWAALPALLVPNTLYHGSVRQIKQFDWR
eukprot:scaffold681433_cov99-Prasinocladus_malaysianus.AAC.1